MKFDMKEFNTGVTAVAAATLMVVGYSYLKNRENRRENTLLNAVEEIQQTFMKQKNKIEETKDKVFEKLLLQEEKIKDMEEERKTTELKVLKMEKSLEEAESEEKRNVNVIAALKKERREQKNRWGEETLQLIREKDGSPQMFVSTDQRNQNLKNVMKATEVLKVEEKKEDGQLENTWTNQFSSSDGWELSLDPNTAQGNLLLSENNRKVTHARENQSYPNDPERFDMWPQVLCRQGLTGRCYWEVEWSGSVSIAVAYIGIKRRGHSDDCLFGYNCTSWSLVCYSHGNRYTVRHNRKKNDLPVGASDSNRVGVYLDWPGGTLSFYSVSPDTRTHLYTFKSKFTEPLFPGFWIGYDCSASLCKIDEEYY